MSIPTRRDVPAWAKAELEPFEALINEMYDRVVELCKDAHQGQLRAAVAELSQTNCSWLLYEMGHTFITVALPPADERVK